MPEEESLSAAIRRLEKYVFTLPKAKQLNMLSGQSREAMIELRDRVTEARVAIIRYQTSDDTKEQAEALDAGIEHISVLNDAMVAASQYDLLGPADVAHLSALAERIRERLQ